MREMRFWIDDTEVTERQAYDAETAGWAKVAQGGSWNVPAELDPDDPGGKSVRHEVCKEMDRTGAHLDWMRGRPLFQRMVRDLRWVHPGVLTTPTGIATIDLPEHDG
jgi:hypothetical protein